MERKESQINIITTNEDEAQGLINFLREVRDVLIAHADSDIDTYSAAKRYWASAEGDLYCSGGSEQASNMKRHIANVFEKLAGVQNDVELEKERGGHSSISDKIGSDRNNPE